MESEKKKEIFDWLVSACLQPSQIGDVGGGIVLVVKEFDQFIDVRPFPIAKVEGDTAGDQAKFLAEQLVNEAEAYVANRGGGTLDFVLRAYREGVRKPLCQRPIRVTLEQENPMISAPRDDGRGVVLNQVLQANAQMAAQNQEMHRTMLDMVRQMRESNKESMHFMSSVVARHEQLAADNFALLRANIENREGREQEAFFTAQKAQDWSELKNMILPLVLPAIMDALKKTGEEGEQEKITATVTEVPTPTTPPNGVS